jgi:beta-glucosidase
MTEPFRDPRLTIEQRLDDLLARMTLAEKVGQMLQLDGRTDAVQQVERYAPGSLLHILDEKLLPAIDAAERTRLGIPLLIGEDGIHGHSFHAGATIFPTQLGLSTAWDPDLAREVARVTAREMATTGAHWTFSPVLCIAREPRWGRVNETFGEDALLIAELGAAMIEGYQGRGLSDPDSVLATAKHYAGYSETQGGRDASEGDLSRRKLRSYFLPPFEHAARAGCRTFMTGYNSIEGLPSTANHWLLTEVLREEWGYSGIVVTDWDNVGRLHWGQRIVPSLVEAAAVAVRCGNDMIMVTPGFYEAAQLAVQRGLLREQEIDRVVRRILRLKFELGLFENPRRPDFDAQRRVIGCDAHRATALRAARECLVLLKNDGILPVDPALPRRIAVVGPNADDDLAQLGDWSLGASQYPPEAGKHPRACTVTLLDGLRAYAGAFELSFEPGCSITDADTSGVAAAAAAVAAADLCVLVLGDHLAFNGEARSTATLELMGGQQALLDAVAHSGTPFVLVLVNGKPLVLPPAAERASALVECFNPGMLGGTAFAELLFGELNPSAKLTMTFPRHVGQLPIFYSRLRHQHGEHYADLTQEPAYEFGFGLSYTRYAYRNLRVLTPKVQPGTPVLVEVQLTNEGGRAGVEIAQVYLRDVVTSVTWPERQLAAFRRVSLAAGETQTVRFEIAFEQLSLVDAYERRVVEPGEFDVLVGGSSRTADLLVARFEVEGDLAPLARIPGVLAG